MNVIDFQKFGAGCGRKAGLHCSPHLGASRFRITGDFIGWHFHDAISAFFAERAVSSCAKDPVAALYCIANKIFIQNSDTALNPA
jgi:hypothetical protein